jgi:hypothetical protein
VGGVILAFCFNVMHQAVQAQTLSNFCGVIHKPKPKGPIAGNAYYDRFGNEYSEAELLLSNQSNKHQATCGNTGFFHLMLGNSIPSQEEAVICQVFQDLSAIIKPKSAGSSVNIFIAHNDGLPTGVLGVGTPMWDQGCGLHNNLIERFINAGVPSTYPSDFTSGKIEYRRVLTNGWYTGTSGNVPNGQFDLYTVILHEALHMLGFASLIDKNPTTLTQFSRWDKYLYSTTKKAYLINKTSNEECCDAYMYNSKDFSNVPEDFNTCDDKITFFDGTIAIAPVNALNTDIGNTLSHLHTECNGNENYVMNPGISAGERKKLTNAERQILCTLGYDLGGDCENKPVCSIIATDDGYYTMNLGGTLQLDIKQLLENDAVPNNVKLTYNANCGNHQGLDITFNGTTFDINALAQGSYTFCYRIEGCDEDCDEGKVKILVMGLPTSCDATCNLIDGCWGDFEQFAGLTTIGNNFFPQAPTVNVQYYTIAGEDNSADIVRFDNNNYLHLFTCLSGCDIESIYFPLSQPVQPKCTVTVDFDGISPENLNGKVLFYASKTPPCSAIKYPKCQSSVFNVCGGVDLTCMLPNSPNGLALVNSPSSSTEVTFPTNSHQNFSWINNTGGEVSFIYVFIEKNIGEHKRICLDNIKITSSCNTAINVTPSVVSSSCNGKTTTLNYHVCATGSGTAVVPVTLTIPNNTLPVGVTIANGGNFNGTNTTTINVVPGQCLDVTLLLNIPSGTVAGTNFIVQANISSTGNACLGNNISTVNQSVTVQNAPNTSFVYSKVQCSGTVTFQCLPPIATNATHSWNFGDGTPNSNQINPTHLYSNACGSVTVTHTVTDICGSKTETKTINLNDCPVPNVTVTTSVKTICGEEQTSIPIQFCLGGAILSPNDVELVINPSNLPVGISLVNGGNFTNGIANLTGLIPNNPNSACKNLSLFLNVNVADGFSFTIPIQIIVKKGNCVINILTKTISLTAFKCSPPSCATCVGNKVFNINTTSQRDRISQFIPTEPDGTIRLNGYCINITGSLRIDAPTILNDCEVKMDAGADIRIENSLVIENQTHLHGCQMMWRGIVVEEEASLNINTHSTIEDAVHAVTLQTNTSVRISETTFNKNYIGIYSPPGGTINVASFQLTGSTFKCDGALLPDPTGIVQGNNTFAGVYLNNTGIINIGFESQSENRFTGIRNGILAVGGLVHAYNNSFHALLGSNYASNIQNMAGCGIFIKKNKATTSAPIHLKKNRFNTCFRAIIVEKSSAEIHENTTDRVEHAILLRYEAAKTALVHDNKTLNANLTGVEITECAQPNKIEVKDNTIHIWNPKNTTLAYGIHSNSSTVAKGKGRILGNDLTIEKGEGIFVQASKGFDIASNYLIVGKSGDFRGINLEGSSDCTIVNNGITGAGAATPSEFFPYSIAINANLSANTYACNDVDKTFYGVRFWGLCKKDDNFSATTFRSHDVGLFLEESAVIGTQKHTSNTWQSSKNITADAECVGDIVLSPFFVNDVPGVFLPITRIPHDDWFDFTSQGIEIPCEQVATPHEDPPIIREQYEVTETDVRNALGKLYEGKHADGLNRIAQQQLYATLHESAYLLGQNKITDAFYTDTAPEDLRDLDYNRRIVEQLNTYSPTAQRQIDSLEQGIDALTKKVAILDANYPTDSNDDNAIKAFNKERAALTLDWYYWQQALDLVAESATQQCNESIESLREGYHRIEPTHIVAKNEIAVKDIYLRDVAVEQNELSKEAIQTLHSIAIQCPLDGGLAVYEARALLNSIKPAWYNDKELCEGGEPIFSKQVAAKKIDEYKVYPNPAQDRLYLYNLTNDKNSVVEINIVDALGTLIKKESIELTGFNTINVEELSSGFYFLTIKTVDKQTVIKFVVSK